VAQVFTTRSEAAIRERAQELVAGAAVAAAAQIPADTAGEELQRNLAGFGSSRQLALFAFGPDGSLLTAPRAHGIAVEGLPNVDALLETALGGRRLVETIDDGRLVTVALPMRREQVGALIAVAERSDLEDALGIVRNEIVSAAIWATLIGAALGLAVALLITRRLRRIARAAADIEQGRFDQELRPRFHDELGALAGTIDSMRLRLSESFERLEGERDRLGRLLEQLQEGVIAVDRDLRVEFANSRAHTILGPDLVPGQRLPEPWPGFPLREQARSLFLPEGEAHTERVSPDGTTTYVLALLPPSAASRTGVLVLTDVTDQERRERAEHEFVTNAAHELRTPLAAIAGAVEVLQQGAKERADDRDHFLAVVERQTERLSRLAHALLTLARAQTRSEPIRLEPVALGPLVREIADGDAGVPMRIELCRADARVLAHRDLLFQALENLAENARKHAGTGVLTVRVTEPNAGLVRVTIEDEGPGMTRNEAYRALDRFYRVPGSDGEGFGLGLAIAREIVGAMDGTLTIESAPGRGTTASIVLPGVRAAAPEPSR